MAAPERALIEMSVETINFVPGMLTLAETGGRLLPVNVAYWLAIGLIAAGCLVIAVVVVFLVRSRRAPGAGLAAGADSPLAQENRPEPMTDEAQLLLRLMGEAEELCHRLGNELDAKADRAERLMARLDGRLGSAEGAANRLSPVPPPPSRASVSPQQPLVGASQEGARPEIVTRPVAMPAAMSMASSVGNAERADSGGSEVDPLAAQIYKLADAGLPSGEIARTLRQHTGKVDLILALRGR